MSVQAAPAGPLPPVESFFGHAQFGSATLSPNGKLLAVVVGAPGKRDSLAVIDLSDDKVYPTAGFNDADIGRVQWVNNKRLMFDTTDKQLGYRDNNFGPGLYAKNVDGSSFKQLAHRRGEQFAVDATRAGIQETLPWNTFMMRQHGAQQSEFAYVVSPKYDTKGEVIHVDLLRLNTLTGRSYLVDAPPRAMRWVLDQRGDPAMAVSVERDEASIHYREPASKSWKKIASYKLYGGIDGYSPLAFGPDGTLYVASNAGKDKQSVYAIDVASGKMKPAPLITSPDYDFNGELIIGRDKLLGFSMLGDSDSTHHDIADGAGWAIAQGIVDPKRICIAGASYGGYAALMGLVNDPELFKCAVNWVGVTDIDLLYSDTWGFEDNISASYRQYGMPRLVGDPVKDAAQFKATSPLHQAARIGQPLLLAYGGTDRRVPLVHGERFYQAFRQTNPNVEWVVYPDEGHGWALPKNEIDFWNRVERFLDRHIGQP